MEQGQIPPGRRYRRVLKEYEQHLKQRERNGDIKSGTVRQYFNDAQVVMESLLAAIPKEEIKAKVELLYRGYYGHVVKELKAIVERRPR